MSNGTMTITRAMLNKYVAPIFETYGENEYASRVILPRVEVPQKEYAYRTQDGSSFRKINTKVGVRGKAARLDSGFDWNSGKTERHFGGLFVPGPLLDEMNAQGISTYLTEEAENAKVPFLIEEEYDLAAVMTDSSNFTNSDTPGTKWDNPSGNMQLDLVKKQETVKLATGGRYADLLVLTIDNYLNAIVQYRSQDGHGLLVDDATLARLFRVQRILVVGGVYNDSVRGQDDENAYIWNQNDVTNGGAWLIYTGGGSRTNRGFGHTAVKRVNGQDVSMTTDVMANPRGTDILIEMEYEQKIRNETACFMFYNTLTT